MRVFTLFLCALTVLSCGIKSEEKLYSLQDTGRKDFVKITFSARVFEFGDESSTILNSDHVQISGVAWARKKRRIVASGLCDGNLVSNRFFIDDSSRDHELKCQNGKLLLVTK
jgi:hypothetical protein